MGRREFYTRDIYPEYQIGIHTYGRPAILHYDKRATLIIGKFCSIADGVVIQIGGSHNTRWITTYPFPARHMRAEWPEGEKLPNHQRAGGDVIIGNDVWVGYGATILGGVHIGSGAVIGARCVVSKDVAPYRIVAGCPMQTIGKRFTEEVIAGLLTLQWWNWPKEKICRNLHLLCGEPPTDGHRLYLGAFE